MKIINGKNVSPDGPAKARARREAEAGRTYELVLAPRGVDIHLSANGEKTLCYLVIGNDWRRHDERANMVQALETDQGACQNCIGVWLNSEGQSTP